MARQCMRPDCDQPVAAHVTLDPLGCAVWLDRPAENGGQAQQLCWHHCESLTVPMGWTITDRRHDPEPQDPVVPDSDSPDSDSPDSGSTASRSTDPRSTAPERSRPKRSMPAPPTPLPGRDAAGGNLLERAMAASGSQRSVLTRPRVTEDE